MYLTRPGTYVSYGESIVGYTVRILELPRFITASAAGSPRLSILVNPSY